MGVGLEVYRESYSGPVALTPAANGDRDEDRNQSRILTAAGGRLQWGQPKPRLHRTGADCLAGSMLAERQGGSIHGACIFTVDRQFEFIAVKEAAALGQDKPRLTLGRNGELAESHVR